MAYRNLDRKIKKLQKQQELKYVDFCAETPVEITGTGDLSSFSPTIEFPPDYITVGTGQNQRVGRTIYATSLHLKMFIKTDTSTVVIPDVYNLVRFLVVRYKDRYISDGTVVNVQNILNIPKDGNTVITPAPNCNVLANYNLDYRASYKILYDEIFPLSGVVSVLETTPDSVADTSGKCWKYVHLKIPLNFEIRFPDGSQDPSDNGIFFFAISDSTITPHPDYFYNGRLYYKDS